jgi:hypothetical protein
MRPVNDTDLEALRRQLPACEFAAYLNAGTFGPLPRVTHAAVADEL